MRIALLVGTAFCFLACGRSPNAAYFSLNSAGNLPGAAQFPSMPDNSLTPGVLCVHPDQHRYPENIAYCIRNVSAETKNSVIHDYDQKLGYAIESMDRQEFKIDHFIPLCMGGGNDVANLWPQHRTVYEVTDPLEDQLCQLMSLGDMDQAKAIETIRYAKHHLDEAKGIEDQMQQRLDAAGHPS